MTSSNTTKHHRKWNNIVINLKILTVLLFFVFLLSGCSNTQNENLTEQELCEIEGGEWFLFPDTCRGDCPAAKGEVNVCGKALTYGCKCEVRKCWNGKSCEKI